MPFHRCPKCQRLTKANRLTFPISRKVSGRHVPQSIWEHRESEQTCVEGDKPAWISHKLATTTADASVLTAVYSVGLLDVLHEYRCRSLSRMSCHRAPVFQGLLPKWDGRGDKRNPSPFRALEKGISCAPIVGASGQLGILFPGSRPRATVRHPVGVLSIAHSGLEQKRSRITGSSKSKCTWYLHSSTKN